VEARIHRTQAICVLDASITKVSMEIS